MKKKTIIVLLALITFSAYAQFGQKENCFDKDRIQIEAKKLESKRLILRLYQNGVFKVSKEGEIIVSDEGSSLIDELKQKGIFEQVDTMTEKVICL